MSEAETSGAVIGEELVILGSLAGRTILRAPDGALYTIVDSELSRLLTSGFWPLTPHTHSVRPLPRGTSAWPQAVAQWLAVDGTPIGTTTVSDHAEPFMVTSRIETKWQGDILAPDALETNAGDAAGSGTAGSLKRGKTGRWERGE